MRLTDRNGKIAPFSLIVPDRAESLTPDTGVTPFTTVNLTARKDGYEQINIEQLQVFAGTTTSQNLELIPLPELPQAWDISERFMTQRQNL